MWLDRTSVLDLGSWILDSGSWILGLGLDLVFCFWSLDFGVWSFEFGILDLGTVVGGGSGGGGGGGGGGAPTAWLSSEGDPALSVPSVALSGAVVSFFRGRPRVFLFFVFFLRFGTLWWGRYGGGAFFFFGVLGRYGGKSNERHRTKKTWIQYKKGKIIKWRIK